MQTESKIPDTSPLAPARVRAESAWARFFLLLVTLCCLFDVSAATQSPQPLVIQATENLVRELRVNGDAIRTTPRLAFELANKEIIPLIDFPTIARQVLGRYWRRASPAQRQRFTHEFRTFVINLYLTAMVTYSQEIVSTADSFEYPPSHWQPGETSTTVRMGFKLKGAAPVEVGYSMHWQDGRWKIYDVQALGLSFIAIYRSNFAMEIKQYGLEGLLKRLAAKNRSGIYSSFANNSGRPPDKK